MDSIYTISLSDYIKSQPVSELNFNTYDIEDVSMSGETFMSRNILNDYLDDISSRYVRLHLTDQELFEYKYRPRLLAHRLYGNPNYYYILLLMNNMCDEKQFNRKTLNILRPEDMINILSAIYNSNVDLIRYHKDYVEENLKG